MKRLLPYLRIWAALAIIVFLFRASMEQFVWGWRSGFTSIAIDAIFLPALLVLAKSVHDQAKA